MDIALVLYTLGAGMVATLNPCGFAMLPAFVSYYLAGGKGAHHEGGKESWGQIDGLLSPLWRALLVGGTLTAGFLVLFAVAGTLISLGVRVLIVAMPWIGLLVGVVLVLLGIWVLLGHHVTLRGLPRLQVRRGRDLKSIFLFGVGYGLASMSCTLPIFLGVVGSAFTSGGAVAGIAQFVTYGLGMGVVLMALTLSLAFFEGVLVSRLLRLVPYVERASAVLLLGAGAYIVYYWLTAGGILQAFG